MLNVVVDGFNILLRGSGQSDSVLAAERGITKLDCAGLRVAGEFNVAYNPLQTLRNGPKSVKSYNANSCELERLECPELTVQGWFQITGNPNLRSLRGCPRAEVGRIDEKLPALFAVGRGRALLVRLIEEVYPLSSTVFRCKLDLVVKGRKVNAKLEDQP